MIDENNKIDGLGDVYTLMDKCSTEKPKDQDIKALRKALAIATPAMLETLGDFAAINTGAILKGKMYQASMRTLTQRDLRRKGAELGRDTAPMMERMLIDAVLLAWLRWQEFEYTYTEYDRAGMSLQKAAFWERRMSAAQARYLKAVETLAKVRKLTSPVLQVNIAQEGSQQVNVGGDLVKNG